MTTTAYIQHSGAVDANALLCELLGEKFCAYRRQWELASNCELLTEFPLFLCLEDSYVCNLRCVHCVHGHEDLKASYGYDETMGDDLYRRIIDEAAEYGCPSMSPNNINEPLLSRDVPDRIRYAADRGFLDISIQTNGLLMTERVIERLIDSGLTRLHVSLDAFSRETYDRVRIGSNFGKVLANIDRFLEIRARRNLKLPLFRASMVRLAMNEHEVTDFVNFWRGKADYVAIQEFASPAPGRADFEPFFSGSRTILSDFRCPHPWQRIVIQGDGAVQPCCSQFSRELTVGNVKETSIRSIWQSPVMNRLRELHRRGGYRENTTCAKCVSSWIGKAGEPIR